MTHYNYHEGSAVSINIAVIGCGKIGTEFINQLIDRAELIKKRKNIDLKIFAIANSKTVVFSDQSFQKDWQSLFLSQSNTQEIHSHIISYAKAKGLRNLVLVDNTASVEVAKLYPYFAGSGFDIVASNKKANTLPWADYTHIHSEIQRYNRTYRYETNVGAGLPLIDNIKMLHLSGERISKICGVFSGSLSYIFNTLSGDRSKDCEEVILNSIKLGYAEPDVRDDLCGEDVARKLVILARELDIDCELSDVQLQNIVPERLRDMSSDDFYHNISDLSCFIDAQRNDCQDDEVLRYVGELTWNDKTQEYALRAELRKVPKQTPVGSLTNADCCFEIYTESYGDKPIVIQGAGAGVKVTARGVFGDVLRIAESKNQNFVL